MGVQNDFFNRVASYAQKAAAVLNIPADVIMAQWAVESDYGRSKIAQGGNLGGVTHTPNSIDGGNNPYRSQSSGLDFAQYNGNLDLFTQDYIRVMKLSYYDKVRAAVSDDDTIKALAESPYDAGHYGGAGKTISDIIKMFNLSQYNAPGTGEMEVKNIPVTVPKGAGQLIIGVAVVTAGLALIKAVAGK